MRLALALLLLAFPVAASGASIDFTAEDSGTAVFDEHVPIEVKHNPGAVIQVIPWGTQIPTMLDDKHFVSHEDHTVFAAPPGYYMLNANGRIRFVQVLGGTGPEPMPEPKPEPKPEPRPEPKPEPVPAPPAELQALVQPIAEKLSGDRSKAERVAWFYEGSAIAMGGAAGERIEDFRTFGAVHAASLRDLSMAGGVKVGSEIDNAIATHVGLEKADDGYVNRALGGDDRSKIVAVFQAIHWAASQQ